MARAMLIKKTSTTLTNRLILLSTFMYCLTVIPSMGADKQSSGTVPKQSSTQKSSAQPQEESELAAEYQFQVLKEPVGLPNLPNYTGQAKFISGLSYPKVKDGATIGLRFAVREEPALVLNWYKEAFRGYQWAYVPTDNGLTATKDGNSCTITLSKPSLVGYKADLEIGYKFAR